MRCHPWGQLFTIRLGGGDPKRLQKNLPVAGQKRLAFCWTPMSNAYIATQTESAMNGVNKQAAAAMDEMAAWGASNVTALPATRVNEHNIHQCYTALQQSLAHYRNAGRMTAAQATKQRHILRAQFLKAEAAEMFDEQWEAYAVECFDEDGYRPSRNSQADVSGAMACWEKWDADGHKLYQQLLHRADCAEIDARNVA